MDGECIYISDQSTPKISFVDLPLFPKPTQENMNFYKI